ncbi:oligosaccharide flippase family protein [Chelativorans sp. YIM 93263]|uniref:oligosaccharide flippase family protein n=1 Tax=Chelativorans sp. YIM 93263 TaxID=2906648 RepID=UPI002378F880|nr:oligosaccharide flippase family protein [Chelativorans sp. YIM 93263]
MQIAGAIRSLRSGEGLRGQLMRGGVGSVAVKIASTLLNVLMAIVLARLLGVEGFGVYSFVFAVVTIMAIPAQMGLPNLVVRETAKAQADGRWDVMKGLWRWASLLALAISLTLIVAGVLAAWVFSERFSPTQLAVFYWGLALVPLIALGNLRGAALRGLRHVVRGQLPEFVLRPAVFIVLVLTAHLGMVGRTLTASNAMMLHAAASLVAFAIGAAMLMRARPAELITERRETTCWRPWLASTLPLAMVEGMHIINQNIGILALGVFANAEHVGLFRVSLQGATMVTIGLTAINLVVGPHFARFHARQDTERLQMLTTLSARAALAIAVLITLVFILFGREILRVLFGSEFEPAYPALIIVSLAQLANAYTGSVGSLLIMSGNERSVIAGLIKSASLNIISMPILIHLWGVNGAALSMSIAIIYLNANFIFSASKKLKITIGPLGKRTRHLSERE